MKRSFWVLVQNLHARPWWAHQSTVEPWKPHKLELHQSTYMLCFFFQWACTTAGLHDPWLLESVNAELWIRKASCKLTHRILTAQGSTVIPAYRVLSFAHSFSHPTFTGLCTSTGRDTSWQTLNLSLPGMSPFLKRLLKTSCRRKLSVFKLDYASESSIEFFKI